MWKGDSLPVLRTTLMLHGIVENHHKHYLLQLESSEYEVDMLGTFYTTGFAEYEVGMLTTSFFTTAFLLDLANYRGTSDRVDSYNNNSPEFLCSY
jgi:hypothetical protein